ncbi:hypothetical protein BDQ17DRAFT_1392690 [Cyathus striatus]|nr:hypothetical protein BDQ17DRAFT_1392690 [Cyathus striatus]
MQELHEISPPDDDDDNDNDNISCNKKAEHSYRQWLVALPQLVDPLLQYISSTTGQILSSATSIQSSCSKAGSCNKKSSEIQCLFFDYFKTFSVVTCECQNTLQVLVLHGLFPTAPKCPRMAISIGLLDFYQALFEKSCEAINALSAAFTRPFCCSISFAVQCYSTLQVKVEQLLELAIIQADSMNANDTNFHLMESTTKWSALMKLFKTVYKLKARSSLSNGSNIIVCVDGNFNQRHLKWAKDTPLAFYEPTYFVPKATVDEVGKHIEKLRKTTQKQRKELVVPDEAVDKCKSAHMAGSGDNVKTDRDCFDDTGLMALVCRHDIPLFIVNIDTAGEQQKYSVALIEHLFGLMPNNATVSVLYDIGCYPILPSDITNRLTFGMSTMHAYVHQWACQLLWQRLMRLITVTRTSAQQKHIWLIDHQLNAVDAPARLKKELDTVLNLQEQLKEKVEELYASLNVQDSFLELYGVDLTFVRTLLMARDLKINIRKRAIGSFFEWDRLDQATGGKDKPLGTKLHQDTREAIAKCKPALMSAIKKFNKYCEKISQLHKPEWNIPLPEPLPTQLSVLCDSSNLMEDVQITWTEDGIRGMLKKDCCLEECRRLGIESDNLCQWFGRELAAIEVAAALPSSELFSTCDVQAILSFM